VAEHLGLTTDTFGRLEEGAVHPHKRVLYKWCVAVGVICRAQKPLVRVVSLSPYLLELLKKSPEELRNLSAEQFENFVAERLQSMGYDVTFTGAIHSRDGGIDLLAARRAGLGSYLIGAQIKHHHNTATKTSRDSVDRLLSWRNSSFKFGLLVTNTAFTRDAMWVAGLEVNRPFLRLRDFFDLKRWLEDRFNDPMEFREFPDEIELAPGVRIKVPRPRFSRE